MAETQYTSTLTGPELDEALRDAAGVDAKVEQAQNAAQQAAQSASSAQGYASAASGSASQASTSAGQAAESAADASGQADAAAESARQAAASASSIEGDVEQAAASANAASQSATQAASSASAAAASATAAADSEDEVQANAAAAQQAATSASASEGNAKASETAAASSAETATGAASAAQTSETNAAESARQAAASVASIGDDVATSAANAQAAQQAASDASASAAAAEDAATRAEQIADFDPSDFATAAQGTKADTAVQSVNGEKPDSGGNVQLDLTTGTVRSVNGKDPDGSGNVQLSAGDVGAATAAQGALAATAVQPADLDDYAKASDIPKKLPNPQALGIRLGQYGSTTYYDGSTAKTVTITPESIGAQPAGAAPGGEVTLIASTGMTSWSQGAAYNSTALATGGYDMVGIVCLCNGATASDEYSPIQWFPIPARGQSRKYGLFCMDVNNSPMGEAQVRMVSITNNGSTIRIYSDTPGYYYNWSNRGQENRCAVPAFIYGIKF